MKDFLRKLSSRKLWIAISGLVVGIAAAFGVSENEYAQIAGIVTSAISVVSYIFGEAEIDAAYAQKQSAVPSQTQMQIGEKSGSK